MALNFRSLAVTVITIFLAACTCAYPTELVESPANLTSRQDVSADAFYFYGYDGCNTPEHPDWSSAILEAWDEVLAIGSAVTSDVDWSSDVRMDFPDNFFCVQDLNVTRPREISLAPRTTTRHTRRKFRVCYINPFETKDGCPAIRMLQLTISCRYSQEHPNMEARWDDTSVEHRSSL
jgi:hypothetical protein